MYFLKRVSMYLVVVLLLVSLYKDLIKDNQKAYQTKRYKLTNDVSLSTSFRTVKVKVQPGDTVLSITEQINHKDNIDIEQLIHDFKMINPFTDPYHLRINSIYYFPFYH